MPMPEAKMSIALLSQAGESGRHLREALVGSGAPIVYEAQAAELDRDALEKSGARVVVVNLDSEVEAHLDEVYSLLGDDRYNVIFNEAQVSSQLSGWEQARWARHLAAKILGAENADPPRPEGAEPVPKPAPRAQPDAPAAEAVAPAEAARPVEAPASPEPPAADAGGAIDSATFQADTADHSGTETAERAAGDAGIEVGDFDDFADIASLLSEVDPEPLEVARTALPAEPRSEIEMPESSPMPLLDLSEFDIEPAPPFREEPQAVETSSPLAPEPAEEIPEFAFPAEMAADGDENDTLGFGDLDDFAGGADAIDFPMDDEPTDSDGHATAQLQEDSLDEAAAGDAAAAGGTLSELQMLDLDWADAPAAPATDTQPEIAESVPPPAIGSAFVWSLEDLDEGGASAAPGADSAPPQPHEFGIETVSPTEYLAPAVDGVVEEPFDTGLSLELIPLEEAVAPQPAGQDAIGAAGRETWLDIGNKPVVANVWVLGASIGGPEAVREFLAEMPAQCPALFLLAQHMGAEFMEIMSQQLARSTALNVRTPAHGERVAHGDIVVVPTTHRLRVDRDGVVTLEAIRAGSLPNAPSIDQVVSDVTDRFAGKAGVIVFSGMAEDGAEGARKLAGKGGKVYVQDPETCVISSMVDGVVETGVVTFAGSPKALAEKVLGDLKSAEQRNA